MRCEKMELKVVAKFGLRAGLGNKGFPHTML